MALQRHSTLFTRVDRLAGNLVEARCTLLSTTREAFGWLVAEIPTLHVEEAGWEVNRSPDDAPGRYDAPQLTGCVAYLDAGPVLRRLLGEPQQAMGRELLSECIRGIVQAETFFIRERGFESGDAYDAFWDRMYAGSCRYYSHPEQVERPWSEYVGSAPRGLNLYNRSITTSGRLDDDGRFMVAGAFVDTFHELGVRVIMDRAGRVARAAGAFVRAPDRICFTTVEHLAALTGRDFPSLTKKELGIMAGGSEGCNHLVDLLHALARTAADMAGQR